MKRTNSGNMLTELESISKETQGSDFASKASCAAVGAPNHSESLGACCCIVCVALLLLVELRFGGLDIAFYSLASATDDWSKLASLKCQCQPLLFLVSEAHRHSSIFSPFINDDSFLFITISLAFRCWLYFLVLLLLVNASYLMWHHRFVASCHKGVKLVTTCGGSCLS